MKVCDKCQKNNGSLYALSLKGRKAELCDMCSQKILEWLNKKEESSGMMTKLFGK